MKLKWYGHASFQIMAQDGTRIVTDPYDPVTSGYRPYTEPADLVVMSSDNDLFHCNAHLVPGNPSVINALELARSGGVGQFRGIEIRAVEAMEALNHREHDPDQNGMYRMLVDGIWIGHMGDMGNAFSAEQLEFFRGTDILLSLVGGHPTLEHPDLLAAIKAIQPKLVVPMHFRTLSYKPRNQYWIEEFLRHFDESQIDFALSSQVEISQSDLPEDTKVLVIDYAH